MRAVVTRVTSASVTIHGKVNGQIGRGYLILLGVGPEDTEAVCDKLAEKICKLRIFEDENEKMNLSIKDVNGELLIISQFTLYGDASHGNRPSFIQAEKPEKANELYEYFISKCEEENVKVDHGIFGADMKVELLNDGPVTIILEK